MIGGFLLAVTLLGAESATPSPTPSPAELAAPTGRTVGVVVLGEDPSEVASLQRAVEERLALIPELVIAPSSSLAAAIAETPPEPVMEGGAAEQCLRLFDEVASLAVGDRLDDALQRLAAISEIHDRTPFVPTSERVKILLWRATIFLARGERGNAEGRVRAAVGLDPEIVVDRSAFPPSIVRLVEEARAAGRRTVRLTVRGVPEGGSIRVDGRTVPATSEVSLERHRVTVGAPGHRWIERVVEVQAEAVLDVTLPLAIPPARIALLTAAVGLVESATLDPALEELFRSTGKDVVVLAIVERPVGSETTKAAAVVWWASRPKKLSQVATRALDLSGKSELLEAVALAVRGQGKTGRRRFGVNGMAQVLAPIRTTSVFGENGARGYRTTYVGAGLRFGGALQGAHWYGELDTEIHSYGTTGIQAKTADGERLEAGAGTAVMGRLGGGYRWLLRGASFDRGTWISAGLAVELERYAAGDFEDSSGEKLGFFASHVRRSSEIQVAAGLPLRDRLAAGGRIGIQPGSDTKAQENVNDQAPLNSWRETPDGTSGTAPRLSTATLAGLFVRYRWSRNLEVRAEYGITGRTVSFLGDARVPVDPRISGARKQEVIQVFGLGAGWAF